MVTEIDRARLVTLIRRGAQVVDVLPPDDYQARHIPGAVNIHLQKLDARSTGILDRSKPVVVY